MMPKRVVVDEKPDAAPLDLTVEDAVSLGFFVALLVVVFLQFFTRYVLNNSFGWTEEIARYLLIATVFSGCLRAARRGGHMSLDLLGRWRGQRWEAVLRRVSDLISLAFYSVLAVLAWQMAGRLNSQRMAVIDLPVSILYYLISVVFAVLVLRAVISFLRQRLGRMAQQ